MNAEAQNPWRYRWKATLVARKHLDDPQDVEDAVQEIMLRAWHRRDLWNPALGDYGAWFQSVARTVAVDCWRRTTQRGKYVVVLDGPNLRGEKGWESAVQVGAEGLLTDWPDPLGEDPLDVMCREESYARALRALERLRQRKPRNADAFQRLRLENVPGEDIAEETGTAYSTIKVRALRAARELRLMIAKESRDGLRA